MDEAHSVWPFVCFNIQRNHSQTRLLKLCVGTQIFKPSNLRSSTNSHPLCFFPIEGKVKLELNLPRGVLNDSQGPDMRICSQVAYALFTPSLFIVFFFIKKKNVHSACAWDMCVHCSPSDSLIVFPLPNCKFNRVRGPIIALIHRRG